MSEVFKKVLLEEKEKKEDKSKNGKMLKKLHSLDDTIDDFIDELEEKILDTEDNPTFIKRCNQLLADLSKERAEFMSALRAVAHAVDRKSKIIPAFEKMESRVRDVRDGMGNDGPPVEEPVEESIIKKVLEK